MPRKPADLGFESWIEQRIERARREGLFDDLPGAGRPLRLDDAADPLWWAKGLVRREQLDLLPGALEIRRTVERTLALLPRLHDEGAVRDTLLQLNAEIRKLNALASVGPPTTQPLLDVEETLASWRRARAGDATS